MTQPEFDFQLMADALGFDEAEFKEVAELLVDTSFDDLTQLETGLADGDVQTVRNAAHSIKGASINLGFTRISDQAKSIEDTARSGRLDGLSSAIDAIRDALNRLQAQLS